MRNIVASLLLANLLLLAWSRWISPDEAPDPHRFGAHQDSMPMPQLVLFSPARVEAPQEQAALRPAAAAQRCERVGPFDSPEPAATIGQQLSGRGLTIDLAHETGDIWVGHWVQVIDMKSAGAARQAVERLVQAGLNDAYVVRSEPTIDISLGVFRGAAGADRVEKVARGVGLEPVRTDRYRTGTQHWVNVELRGDQALELTDLQLPSSQILRTESVACRPTADTIADAAEDSLESVAEAGGPE